MNKEARILNPAKPNAMSFRFLVIFVNRFTFGARHGLAGATGLGMWAKGKHGLPRGRQGRRGSATGRFLWPVVIGPRGYAVRQLFAHFDRLVDR